MAETVLIVEDEPEFAALVELWVGQAGYRTVTARTGPDALRRFHDERPDLVVLDVALPGLDGWQLLERTTTSRSRCPSRSSSPAWRPRCDGRGPAPRSDRDGSDTASSRSTSTSIVRTCEASRSA